MMVVTSTKADTYSGVVLEVQPNHATYDCFFFKIAGVVQTNPASPNPGWFAVQRSLSSSKESFATVLSARLTGGAITVNTGGGLVCGYPEATYINF